jgi:hypothetical protein
MRRALTVAFALTLAGCQCGPTPDVDAGFDAGADAGGPSDAGADAGPSDGGPPDGGPLCSLELCDGIDNDCNGTIDLAADGGVLVGLCPLQLGTCQGARVQCVAGQFPACAAAEYGAKYEEFESLCDGVDNDCSGVVDVSQWRATGAGPTDSLFAVSVPGGWYVATGTNAQMFDEQLRPTSDLFPVGRAGASDIVATTAIAFGGYLNLLFTQLPAPGATYVRRLNLDGTYATGADGGALEIDLLPAHSAPLIPGALRTSNDRGTLLITFSRPGSQELLTLWPDGGTRAGLTQAGDAGQWRSQSTAVGAEEFVTALPYPFRLELRLHSADLQPLGTPVNLATPAEAIGCDVSTQTMATDAGAESIVVVCPDQRHLYAAEDIFAGGTLVPFWETDAGTIANVRVLPSYAKATAFWMNTHGTSSTIWMTQLGALPLPIGDVTPTPTGLHVAPSIRGGYLLGTIFDGGQGFRPYGAYVCPP